MPALREVGMILDRNQVLDSLHGLLIVNCHRVGGNDMRLAERRVREPAPRQRRQDDQLLLPDQALRRDQGLPPRRHLRHRAGHFDRRQCAPINLILVVVVQPLREPQRLPLYFDV
jgi:hypothetical protein